MISRVENEINLNWAEQNPESFVKSVLDFQKQYSNTEWKITVDLSRDKYMILTATRKFTDQRLK